MLSTVSHMESMLVICFALVFVPVYDSRYAPLYAAIATRHHAKIHVRYNTLELASQSYSHACSTIPYFPWGCYQVDKE